MVRSALCFLGILLIVVGCGDEDIIGEWVNYTTEDGLPGLIVYSATEDANKTTWVSCSGGIARLEGAYFIPYTEEDGLPSNEAVVIVGYNSGVAVGTDKGLALFDGDEFIVYNRGDGLPSNNVQSLASGSEGLWVGTDAGLSFFDGSSFTTYNTENSDIAGDCIWALALLNDDVVIGTESGLSIFTPPDDWKNYDKGDGLPSDVIYALWVDDGVIWGGGAYGAFKIEGGDVFAYTPENSQIPYSDVMGVCVDDYGDVWFATYGGGICMLSGSEWHIYMSGEGPISDWGLCAFCSSYNTLWFGTTDGLSRHIRYRD
ncbi:MAG: hypothetical protein DRH49_01760 [Candidatus Coatesbacteria bacterium]|nr:MAG: hypothetical protein DRH49_01760 [Candidatus Coatesbacteria bacterium]